MANRNLSNGEASMEHRVEIALKAKKPKRKTICRPRRICRWMVLQFFIMCLYLVAFFWMNSDLSLIKLEGRSVGAPETEVTEKNKEVPAVIEEKKEDIVEEHPVVHEEVPQDDHEKLLEVKHEAVAEAEDEGLEAHMAHVNDTDETVRAIQLEGKPEENHQAIGPNEPGIEREIKETKDAEAERKEGEPIMFEKDGNKLVLPPELAAKEPAENVYKILLFTYMRGGSSFLGQMFDKNPDAMYLFEPLDGAYSSLYGVPLLVPSLDLTHFTNGSKRDYSMEEKQFIAETVNQILSCQHWKLPTEILIHPFVYRKVKSKSFHYYGECVSRFNIESFRWKCVPFKPTCDKQKDDQKGLRCNLIGKDLVRLALQKTEKEYWDCLEELRRAAMYCVSLMEAECRRTSLRALKSVRLTADIAQLILENYRDIKILYYLRDPRGIVVSRQKEELLSSNSQDNIVEEVKMLGEDMAHDIEMMLQLQKNYPSRIKFEFYEEFAKNPTQVARDAYIYVGMDMPPVVSEHLYNITHAGSDTEAFETARTNASATALAWWTKLDSKVILKMNSVLDPFFNAARQVSAVYIK